MLVFSIELFTLTDVKDQSKKLHSFSLGVKEAFITNSALNPQAYLHYLPWKSKVELHYLFLNLGNVNGYTEKCPKSSAVAGGGDLFNNKSPIMCKHSGKYLD